MLLIVFLFPILREPDPNAKDARIPVEDLPRFVSVFVVKDRVGNLERLALKA